MPLQIRAVQKALLVRYQEDKPTDLASLPLLMEASLHEVTDISNAVLEAEEQLAVARDDLSRATHLILCCLRCGSARQQSLFYHAHCVSDIPICVLYHLCVV